MAAGGSVRAIVTSYGGCRFRSRLEARWAVFFDALAVAWSYEPEGFELAGGRRYLPDFWLPELQLWLEVKGARDDAEVEAWLEFAAAADPDLELPADDPGPDPGPGRPVRALPRSWRGRALLAFGDIPDPRRPAAGDSESMLVLGDWWYRWTRCPSCGQLGAEWEGRAERLPCPCEIPETSNATDPVLLRAYAAARGARFEHGDRERW